MLLDFWEPMFGESCNCQDEGPMIIWDACIKSFQNEILIESKSL